MTLRVLGWLSCVALIAPGVAAAQDPGRVSVQVAAGGNINVPGNTQAVSIGVAVGDRINILVGGERIHMPTEITEFENGMSATRGGTTTFVSGEVQVLPFTFDRVSPYVLAGVGRGVTRLNVNDIFPNPVTNDATMMFFGGGLRIPVTDRLSVFGDLRFTLQLESAGDGGVFLFVPVRGGVAWRF